MGKGEIISGGTDGQYQVKVLFDKTNYNTLLAALNARIPELETQITNIQNEINQLNSDISTLDQRIDVVRAERDSYNPESKEYQAKDQELSNLISQKNSKVSEKRRKEIDKKIKELEKKSLEKRLEYIENNFPDDETLFAWCADLTEDLSGNVGTLEIPGERGTLLIQPGYEDNAVYNVARDGQLQPLITANPYQTYYNLAMFPGWQKWKPTFRFGTITSIDSENDKANVTIDSANSSQQALNINQSISLTDVPIEYMSCNSSAFEVDDEVVVKFEYDWATPKVIGFKDNPKACYELILVIIDSDIGEYCIVWNPITNAYATGIKDNEGETVTFPCLKSSISDWIDSKSIINNDLFTPSFLPREGVFYPLANCSSGYHSSSDTVDFHDEDGNTPQDRFVECTHTTIINPAYWDAGIDDINREIDIGSYDGLIKSRELLILTLSDEYTALRTYVDSNFYKNYYTSDSDNHVDSTQETIAITYCPLGELNNETLNFAYNSSFYYEGGQWLLSYSKSGITVTDNYYGVIGTYGETSISQIFFCLRKNKNWTQSLSCNEATLDSCDAEYLSYLASDETAQFDDEPENIEDISCCGGSTEFTENDFTINILASSDYNESGVDTIDPRTLSRNSNFETSLTALFNSISGYENFNSITLDILK